MDPSQTLAEQMLIAIRRVSRAIDLHSRALAQSHGLTGPQAMILKVIDRDSLSASDVAQRVNLSNATVTDIVKRLESRGLVRRERDQRDRRRVMVQITPAGHALIAGSPPLLQERFVARFKALAEWEQNLLLSSLQRIAEMMDAGDLDAAPLLSSGPVQDSETQVDAVLEEAVDTDDLAAD